MGPNVSRSLRSWFEGKTCDELDGRYIFSSDVVCRFHWSTVVKYLWLHGKKIWHTRRRPGTLLGESILEKKYLKEGILAERLVFKSQNGITWVRHSFFSMSQEVLERILAVLRSDLAWLWKITTISAVHAVQKCTCSKDGFLEKVFKQVLTIIYAV